MKEIYMQRTVDYILKEHSHRIGEVESKGVPEVVELLDDKGEVNNKYFIFRTDD